MPYRLVALEGSLRDGRFGIGRGGLRIGRAAGNDIALNDPGLSRHHCTVHAVDDQVWVVDEGSRNGTFVNDTRITRRTLAPGDRVRLGETTFALEWIPDDLDGDVDERGRQETVLGPGEARYLASGAGAADPELPRPERDLSALLALSQRIATLRERSTLERGLVDAAAALLPAELVALVLFGAPGAPPRILYGTGDRTLHISRSVLSRVHDTASALLSTDVGDRHVVELTMHGAGRQARSIVCAPLGAPGSVAGVLYVASWRSDMRFEPTDLQLLAAVAGIGAIALENVGHIEWLGREAARPRDVAPFVGGIVGESAAMQEVLRFVGRVARADATVLILGESGSGKEVVARAIHAGSPRAGRPFLAVNCATLAEALIESELFGHERGAFTGAVAAKPGKLELADAGTLFLDEVGELPLTAQAKLLRALQERQFERVGGTRTIRVDVRVVAATNRDLDAAVRAGTFRADLFHRLNVLTVTLPPLRQRREDVPRLAAHFFEALKGSAGRPLTGISAAARDLLVRYDWPGNVRELQNTIERAVVLGVSDRIEPEDLPEALHELPPADAPEAGAFHSGVNAVKRQLLLDALSRSGFNYTVAAQDLGLHPNYLHRLIRSFGLKEQIDAARRRRLSAAHPDDGPRR